MKQFGKKLLAFALALCMVLSMLTVASAADSDPTQNYAFLASRDIDNSKISNVSEDITINHPENSDYQVSYINSTAATWKYKADSETFTNSVGETIAIQGLYQAGGASKLTGGVPENRAFKIELYTPADLELFIGNSSSSGTCEVKLVDDSGNVTAVKDYTMAAQTSCEYVSDLAAGTYYLYCESKGFFVGAINVIPDDTGNLTLDDTTNRYLYIFDTGYILSSTSIPSPTTAHDNFISYKGNYTLSGGTAETPIAARVIVTSDYAGGAEDDDRTITISGLNIDVSNDPNSCAFELQGTAKVTLLLVGENTLKSGSSRAGLQVPTGASISIGVPSGSNDNSGSLTAASNGNGAGIGAGNANAGGTIKITGGTVTAYSSNGDFGNGAGIGGGNSGAGGSISISGGTVTAISGNGVNGYGAGIGGGKDGDGGNISISGGTVTAISGNGSGVGIGVGMGAGIGGGNAGAGGTITITGGTVMAYSSYGNKGMGAGIGGGLMGAGGTITISGGTVTAYSSGMGTGIGGGSASGAAGTIKITGGSVLGMNKPGEGGVVSVKGQPTDGAAESPATLYLTTLTLGGVSEATAITGATGLPDGYGLTDVKTDASGKVYVWLPANATAAEISLTTGADGSAVTRSATLAIKNANTNAATLKQAGGTVSNPTGTVSGTTITAASLTASTNQTVEYAVSASNTSAPTGDWQTGLAFSDLIAGDYYLWARAKESDSHFVGTAAVSESAYTIATPGIPVATAVTATVNGTTITADAITMTGYTVEYAVSDGNTTAPTDGWQTTLEFSSLAVGDYYLWARVKASDTYPAGTAKVSASAYTIAAQQDGGNSGGNGSGGGSSSGASKPAETAPDSNVLIDGKPVSAGKITIDAAVGETVLTLDPKVIADAVTGNTSNMEITIPLDEKTPSAVARIPAESIEMMQDSSATLTVTVGDVQYSLPASAIDLPTLLEQLSAEDASDVTLDIHVMPVADDATKREVAQALRASGGEAVVPAMQFEVIARYGDESVSVNRFPSYVTRTVALTAEQAAQVSTAVLVDANGKARHVPTKLTRNGNEHFAEISSLTNSIYVLIANEVSFPDIAGTWFTAYAQEVGNRKIVNGYPDGTFSGDSSITRAEFAQILVNALGLPSNGDGTVFADVDANAWYCGAVGTAFEYGLVSGKGNAVFDPQASITRQESMQMIRNAAKIAAYQGQSGSLSDFSDAADVAAWAENAVKFCVGSGLVVGSDGKVMPQASISRAETATIVLRLLQEEGLVDVRS